MSCWSIEDQWGRILDSLWYLVQKQSWDLVRRRHGMARPGQDRCPAWTQRGVPAPRACPPFGSPASADRCPGYPPHLSHPATATDATSTVLGYLWRTGNSLKWALPIGSSIRLTQYLDGTCMGVNSKCAVRGYRGHYQDPSPLANNLTQ